MKMHELMLPAGRRASERWAPQFAALAFSCPAFIFLLYRFGLQPLFNGDPYFIYFRATDLSLTDAFSASFNPVHFRPLSHYLEGKIAFLYTLHGAAFHKIILLTVAFLIGMQSLLVFLVARAVGARRP